MMKTNFITVFFTAYFLLNSYTGNSQSFFLDTIKKSLHTKPTPEIWLDGRNSFLTGSKAPINGLKLGLDFNSKFFVGLGWQWITDKRGTNTYDTKFTSVGIDLRKTKLHYLSIYAEYVFFKRNRWKFSIMPQIGFGKTFYSYYNSKDIFIYRTKGTNVLIYEPVMSGSYKFFKYLGLSASIGGRFVFKNNKVVSDVLTSPIYSFGISIYWWTIYKTITKDKKWLGNKIGL